MPAWNPGAASPYGSDVYVEEHGAGDAAIVLLHGFGATGAVWRRTVGELGALWSGRIVVCDLPGHGGSPALPAYPYSAVAEAVAGVLPHSEGWSSSATPTAG